MLRKLKSAFEERMASASAQTLTRQPRPYHAMWPQQLERWQDLARFTPLRTAAAGTITSAAGEQVNLRVLGCE
jgi:hypothetical protein